MRAPARRTEGEHAAERHRRRMMRIVVLHNLLPGGAHRRLREQMARLDGEVAEVCLGTAAPIRSDAHVIAFDPRAPRLPAAMRVPVRYGDLFTLMRAWRRAAERARALGADVVFANPCRFLQAPAALLADHAPALYFCDEPRRIDHDPSAIGSRRALTRPVYAPMYALERRLDGQAVRRAAALATNSAFTAAEIERAYGRRAEIVPQGVSEVFRAAGARLSLQDAPAAAIAPAVAPDARHVLSVGALIPSKGHDLAIDAVAAAGRRRALVVVAPGERPAEAARLRARAAAAGVDLALRIGVSDEELAGLYTGAHVTLYLAEREPFGLAALEAQACGSPVIVAGDGGLPETLAADQAEWVVARGDARTIRACLEALEDPARRAAAVQVARAHALPATWERSAARIRELLLALGGRENDSAPGAGPRPTSPSPWRRCSS